MHNKIEKISQNIKSKFHYNYDVSKLTWFKAGGKADAYCLVNNLTDLEIILNSIENMIIESGSMKYAEDYMLKISKEAIEMLNIFEDSDTKKSLILLVRYNLERSK